MGNLQLSLGVCRWGPSAEWAVGSTLQHPWLREAPAHGTVGTEVPSNTAVPWFCDPNPPRV